MMDHRKNIKLSTYLICFTNKPSYYTNNSYILYTLRNEEVFYRIRRDGNVMSDSICLNKGCRRLRNGKIPMK